MIITALVSAGVAAGLTRWMRTFVDTESRWSTSGMHIVLAGVGGAGAAALAQGPAELLAYTMLAVAAALLVVIDLAALRLPDLIVGPMYLLLFAALTVAAATADDWSRLGRAAAVAALLFACYLVLAFISPAGLGLGDVKLSGLLGAFLGWLGWTQAFVGALSAFILVAVVSLVLLAIGRTDRRGAVPFGPWMISGAALAALLVPAGG